VLVCVVSRPPCSHPSAAARGGPLNAGRGPQAGRARRRVQRLWVSHLVSKNARARVARACSHFV